MTEKIDFQAFMAAPQEGQNAEYEAAFNAYCDLEKLEAERVRCAVAAEQSTGLERESNIRQIAEIGAAINRVQATLKAIQEGGGITAPLWRGTSFDGGLTGRELKYQRFDAEDVAEALRYEIEARQAKLRAEQIALSNEFIGPYQPTWDFWQALFERRDVKALADFEVGDEFQAALEYSIRVLETSPRWASRPERDWLLVQYRRRCIEHASRDAAIGEPHHADPVQKGRPRSDAPERLEEILVALEIYAAETGQMFDRDAMPGPVGEGCDDEGSFHWFCAKLRPHAFMKSRSTFERQRTGVCKMGLWARPTDFYREALPHIAPKLGVKLNVNRLQSRASKAA